MIHAPASQLRQAGASANFAASWRHIQPGPSLSLLVAVPEDSADPIPSNPSSWRLTARLRQENRLPSSVIGIPAPSLSRTQRQGDSIIFTLSIYTDRGTQESARERQ